MILPNYLVSINNIKDIDKYKKVGLTTFLFALKEYSIGYESYFDVDTINQICGNKYVLINRLLDSKDIDNLKKILPNLHVNGFIFEDIGLINVFKELDIKGQKILFMNHFNCNYASINTWLNYVDSVFVSNELTEEEYDLILKNVSKPIVVNIFGYNEIMYSRRFLLTNFYKNFKLKNQPFNTIEDKVSHIKFHLVESEYGTIALSEHIYDGRRLYNKNNILFYYINMSFISNEKLYKFLKGETVPNSDNGFLDTPTVYKIRGDN